MEHELSLVHVLPRMVWTASPNGHAECAGAGWLDFTGLAPEAAAGDGWRCAVHSDDIGALLGVWRATVDSGSPGEIGARMRRNDGTYHRFLLRLCPLTDTTGAVVRLCILHSLIPDRSTAATRADECGLDTNIEDIKRADADLRAHRLAAERAQADSVLIAREAELRRANQYLSIAQRLSQTGSYSRDVATDKQTLSEEMYRICEFDPKEPVTHEMVLNRIHPEDLEMFKEMQRRALASGSDFDMTYRMVIPSGAVKHLRSSSQRLTELPDRLVYVGATQDITQWKLAEAALRSNEAELRRANDDLLRAYRHIAEAQRLSNSGSFTLDFSKNDLYWSEELYRIFELDPSTTITLDLVKGMVHPEDVPAYLAAVEGAAAGLTIDFAYRIVTNGHIKHLRAVGHRIEHAGDRPMFVGAVQDVTESRLAENALRQGEALLTQAEAVSETGSFLWDLESGDIRWSDELYRIFEFEPHSLITLARIAGSVHPDDRSAMEEMIGRAHAGLDSEYFHRICLSGGSVRYLHFVARSFRDEGGQLRYLGTVQNITERTLAEEAFDRVRSELAHAARAMSLGVLTASIAHEVNQPLTSLVTNAGTCIRVLKGPEPDVQLALTMAQRTIRDANRASDVIRRLRAMFSRKRSASEEVDLNEATREVLALSGSTLQSARIVIRARLDEDLPKIRGDRVQLQQVILNLVLNATDAMRSVNDRRRHLTIVTSRGGRREVSLSVRDSGTGVESGNVERLFDAFYTTKSEGMGIGLSISRSIIQGHAGRLWAAPNGDGPGATFTFSIPCDLAASNTEDAKEV